MSLDELATGGRSSQVADNGIFPVRVIDVKGTFRSMGGIVFSEPKDWHFHTISHTWSMEIRKLSEEVGSKVMQQKTAYNEVFKHEKLYNQPGYVRLLEFLKIIQADGVERVWFDALCINQVDDQEKSHEIVHMGAFYFHSLGCYVTAHGFGRGFRLTDCHHQSARWFSRAWTLQEWLLPKTLTFVVELSRPQIQEVVMEVRKMHELGECDCKGVAGSAVWLWGCRERPFRGRRKGCGE